MNLDIGYPEPSTSWSVLAILVALPVVLAALEWRRSGAARWRIVIGAAALCIAIGAAPLLSTPAYSLSMAAVEIALGCVVVMVPALAVSSTAHRYMEASASPRLGRLALLSAATWTLAIVVVWFVVMWLVEALVAAGAWRAAT